MPQPPADVQAPTSTPTTAAPGRPVSSQAPTAAPSPISPQQAEFLRARRSSLSNQLESAQGRRDDVAEELRSDETQAAERPGLQDRLRVLDERLVQIERDIATNGEQLANAPPRMEAISAQSPRGRFSISSNALNVAGLALLIVLAINLSRRFFAPNRGPSRAQSAEIAALNERLNRMENAVDAVAIEVERIGEGQRFLTQAMADPIARRIAEPVAASREELDGSAIR